MLTNTRRTPSDQNRVGHKKKSFFSIVKKNLFNFRVVDIEKKDKYIEIALSGSSFIKSLFHNIGLSYYKPNYIMKKREYEYLSQDEKSLVTAAYIFNSIVNNKSKYSKVIFEEQIIIRLRSDEHSEMQEFVIDEKKLFEILVKYKTKEEVRKFIREIFSF